MEKQFFGTCVDNPFSSVDRLTDICERSRPCAKSTFLKECDLDESTRDMIRRYPNDYSFRRTKDIYFFVWSAIEHFYK